MEEKEDKRALFRRLGYSVKQILEIEGYKVGFDMVYADASDGRKDEVSYTSLIELRTRFRDPVRAATLIYTLQRVIAKKHGKNISADETARNLIQNHDRYDLLVRRAIDDIIYGA